MRPEIAGRTDWYAYDDDNYGRARGNSWKERPATKKFVSDMSKEWQDWKVGYQPCNEMMFRAGISKDEFLGISCEDDFLRTELLDKLRKAGINQINGIDIEDFVHVSTAVGEDSDLGLQGLAYYKNKKKRKP